MTQKWKVGTLDGFCLKQCSDKDNGAQAETAHVRSVCLKEFSARK
jgi:hypothetical protein